MNADWLILHGGALGDLVLTIQLALRLPRVSETGRLHLVSRSHPGDLSSCRPGITRQSADGLGLHWLYGDHDDPPPRALYDAVRGARVLNALGDVGSVVHRRLETLNPAGLFSFDPRPRRDLHRHITQQWQTELEAQGLLIPKCIHQHPNQRTLGVPVALRARGRDVLRQVGSDGAHVLIHAGSGGREKCWPLASFLDVARRLTQRGVGVCFLIGPVELEWWPRADLAAIEREYPVLRLPVPGALAAALAAAKIVVANDSGPAQLAALLGTRTVTVFGPTSPTVWRPLGREVHVVAGNPQTRPGDWGIDPQHVASLALDRA